MSGRNEQETPRGRFYSFDVPQNPASLIYTSAIYPDGKIIQTQFSAEEIEYIRRARKANAIPEILDSAALGSPLRAITTYARVPYYGELIDRRKALEAMQHTVKNVDYILSCRLPEPKPITTALQTIKTNLLPFLPPEKPPLRER